MFAQQIQQQLGVGRVVLRAAGPEGFPIPRQRLRIDRIEHENLVHHQGVHHRAVALLDGDPHGAAVEPLP